MTQKNQPPILLDKVPFPQAKIEGFGSTLKALNKLTEEIHKLRKKLNEE